MAPAQTQAQAAFRLGLMHRHGGGVAQDAARALTEPDSYKAQLLMRQAAHALQHSAP